MSNLEFFTYKLRDIAERAPWESIKERVVSLLRQDLPIDPAVSAVLKQWAQDSLIGLEREPRETLTGFVVPGTGARTTHISVGPNDRLTTVLETTISELEYAEKRRAKGKHSA